MACRRKPGSGGALIATRLVAATPSRSKQQPARHHECLPAISPPSPRLPHRADVVDGVHGSALVVYNAGISACEKGGQWQQALSLLRLMWEAKSEPTVISVPEESRTECLVGASEKPKEPRKRHRRLPDARRRPTRVRGGPQDGPRGPPDGRKTDQKSSETA